jgi:hypothetical protein
MVRTIHGGGLAESGGRKIEHAAPPPASWRRMRRCGARRDEAIVSHRNDHGNPRLAGSINSNDVRCGLRSS